MPGSPAAFEYGQSLGRVTAVHGSVVDLTFAAGKLPAIVEAFEKAKKASSKAEIVALTNDCDLPREAIPSQWLNEAEVWDALLQRMPPTALVWSHAWRPPLSARSFQP